MLLRDIAHTRAGDKGDISNISVIAYHPRHYPLLEQQLTAERVRQHLGQIVQGDVVRYTLPRLGALNFVLHRALGGGVTRSLALDAHGKSLSSAILGIEIFEPDITANTCAVPSDAQPAQPAQPI